MIDTLAFQATCKEVNFTAEEAKAFQLYLEMEE